MRAGAPSLSPPTCPLSHEDKELEEKTLQEISYENDDVKSKLHNKRLNQTAATNVQPRRDSESGKGGAKRSKRIANEKYKVTMTYIET